MLFSKNKMKVIENEGKSFLNTQVYFISEMKSSKLNN